MTTGNMIDLGIIIVLNLVSTITCYMFYFPEGYESSNGDVKVATTKKAVFLRWSKIVASLFFGIIDIILGIVGFIWEKIKSKKAVVKKAKPIKFKSNKWW
jgi:hypothetical protein